MIILMVSAFLTHNECGYYLKFESIIIFILSGECDDQTNSSITEMFFMKYEILCWNHIPIYKKRSP